MEQKLQVKGLINLLMLAGFGVMGFAAAQYSHTMTGLTASIFLGLGALVAAVSWFQMGLEEREQLEKLEFQELTRSGASSALFNPDETEVFPAQRSREQFERFFVPGFSILLCLLQVGLGLLMFKRLKGIIPVPIVEPTAALATFGFSAVMLFLRGKYASSLARKDKIRLLRPGSSYVLLGAYVSFVVAAAIAAVMLDYPVTDLYVARALAGLLVLVGIETLINLILELYRPRVKGKIEPPVYESRVVSLLGQPEGLVTTLGQTLDYQFGFNVSETWAFRLFWRYLPWLVGAQLAILLISTSFVFIDAGQQAVLEYNGSFVRVLGPGAHLKAPWPISQVYRFATEQIQSIFVGYTPTENPAAGNIVLWTLAHDKEENFLVANHVTSSAGIASGDTSGTRPPPVSLLTVSIPVQFQVTNLESWVYHNEDPVSLLQDIATREVVRYLVSVDLQEIMSEGRWDAGQILRDRIQAEAVRHDMGANIIFVGLQDIHPPTKVAADYEKVVSAIHTKEAAILAATAEAIRATNLADAQAFKTVSVAKAESKRLAVDALARAALFTNQIPAYLAAPSVYAQRAYLQMLSRSVTNARTYVMLATNTQDVIILNLEDKIRKDILEDITVPPPKQPK
jgi:regulator of protease activity HflC (stomatin/prohibitin superfamily)